MVRSGNARDENSLIQSSIECHRNLYYIYKDGGEFGDVETMLLFEPDIELVQNLKVNRMLIFFFTNVSYTMEIDARGVYSE